MIVLPVTLEIVNLLFLFLLLLPIARLENVLETCSRVKTPYYHSILKSVFFMTTPSVDGGNLGQQLHQKLQPPERFIVPLFDLTHVLSLRPYPFLDFWFRVPSSTSLNCQVSTVLDHHHTLPPLYFLNPRLMDGNLDT